MTESTLSEPVVLPMPSPNTTLPADGDSLGAVVEAARAEGDGEEASHWWRKLGLSAAAGRATSDRQHTANVRAALGSAPSRCGGLIRGRRVLVGPRGRDDDVRFEHQTCVFSYYPLRDPL